MIRKCISYLKTFDLRMRFAMRERTVPLELNCNTAEAALAWAGQQNPGNWIGHSRFVALACKNIAAKCNNMDAD